MKFTLTGTGSASQLPVFNCQCIACQRARTHPQFNRLPASAALWDNQKVYLFDTGLTDLTERYLPQQLQAIFQTHYHADHAQGLLQLRWAQNITIPIYGPNDPKGFADLYKNSLALDFSPILKEFETVYFEHFNVTAIPLQHSRPTLGYLIDTGRFTIAYLTDTKGLANNVLHFLKNKTLDYLILDSTFPPKQNSHLSHNDLNKAIQIHDFIQAKQSYLTHIDHTLDAYLMKATVKLPQNLFLAYDNLSLAV